MVDLISKVERDALGIDSIERALMWSTLMLRAAYEGHSVTNNKNYFSIEVSSKPILDEQTQVYYLQKIALIVGNLEFGDDILTNGGNVLVSVKELVGGNVSYTGSNFTPSEIIKTPIENEPVEVDTLEKFFYWCVTKIQSNRVVTATTATTPRELKELDILPSFNESTTTPKLKLELSLNFDNVTFLNSNNLIEAVGFETRPSIPSPVVYRTWRGGWSAITNYVQYDGVSYNGSSYIALEENLNEIPENSDKWDLMALGADLSGFYQSRFIPSELHNVELNYYVDLVNGDDSNDGLTFENAFFTIDKAIEVITLKRVLKVNVNVQGTITNYVFNVGSISSGAYENNIYWAYEYDHQIIFKGYGTGFTINTNYDNNTQQNLVEGSYKIGVTFQDIDFTFDNNSNPISFYQQKVSFIGCNFSEPTTSNFYDGFIFAEKSDIYIQDLTILTTINWAYCWIAGQECILQVGSNVNVSDYNLSGLTDSRIIVRSPVTTSNPDSFTYGYSDNKIIFKTYPNQSVIPSVYDEKTLNGIPINNGVVINHSEINYPYKHLIGHLSDSAIIKNNIELTFSCEILANTAIYVRFPDYTRIACVHESFVRLDTTVDISGLSIEETLLFTDDQFSNINGNQVVERNSFVFALTNFDVFYYVGSYFNNHDPVNDNLNHLKRTYINGGNGLGLGLVYDNCYPESIYANFKVNCILR